MTKWLLSSKPFTVQTTALERAAEQMGFGYFMEMGLGKTAVALAEYASMTMKGQIDGMMVLCPNTVKSAWKTEIEKQTGANIPVAIWPEEPPGSAFNGVFIMNYEALLTDKGQAAITKFYTGRRVYLCADESHRIKNWKAKTTKYALIMAKNSTITRAMSGSPMTQNVMDYYSQLKFIGRLQGMNPIAFRATFALMGGYMAKQVVGIRNKATLEEILTNCSFRALKKDWTDLPEKLYTIRTLELSSKVQKLYDEMKREFVVMVGEEEVAATMVISQMMKLQQISSGFLMNEKGVAIPLIEHKDNKKVQEVLDTLEQIRGPLIIFAHYRYSIAVLTEALAEFKPAHIVGGMTTADVEEQKRRFNNGDTRVIICQMQTGSLGHTLLGPSDNQCSTTFFYENSYVLGDRMQAEDRNHRHGQRNAVTYVDCVSSNIEEKVIGALQRKLNLVNTIVEAVKEIPNARATVSRKGKGQGHGSGAG